MRGDSLQELSPPYSDQFSLPSISLSPIPLHPHSDQISKKFAHSHITPTHTHTQTLHLPLATHRLRCRSVFIALLPPLHPPSVDTTPSNSKKFSTSPPQNSINTPSRPPIPSSILHSPRNIQDRFPPHHSHTLLYNHIPLKNSTFHQKINYLPHIIELRRYTPPLPYNIFQ